MNQLMLRYSLRQCFLDGPALVRGPIWQILTKDANKKHDQHQPQTLSTKKTKIYEFFFWKNKSTEIFTNSIC